MSISPKILYLYIPLFLSSAIAWAEPIITGPVSAKVIKVYDGDTFTVEASPADEAIDTLLPIHGFWPSNTRGDEDDD